MRLPLKFILPAFLVALILVPGIASAGPGLPFGGQIIQTIPCPCSFNFLIINRPIGPTSVPNLTFEAGSILYAFYNIFTPGNFILGTYTNPSFCAIPGPSGCTPPIIIPSMRIFMIGTSGGGLPPGIPGGSGEDDSGSDDDDDGDEEELPPGEGDCMTKKYLIANEGWKNTVYTDSLGYPTVGVGHKLEPGDGIRSNETLSDAEVGELFERDYAKHEAEARASARRHGVEFDNLSEGRQTVLVDMAFNMGAQGGGGLDGFNQMYDAIREGDWDRASLEVMDSQYAGQTGARSRRNARMMREGTTDVAEDYAADHEDARHYECED